MSIFGWKDDRTDYFSKKKFDKIKMFLSSHTPFPTDEKGVYNGGEDRTTVEGVYNSLIQAFRVRRSFFIAGQILEEIKEVGYFMIDKKIVDWDSNEFTDHIRKIEDHIKNTFEKGNHNGTYNGLRLGGDKYGLLPRKC